MGEIVNHEQPDRPPILVTVILDQQNGEHGIVVEDRFCMSLTIDELIGSLAIGLATGGRFLFLKTEAQHPAREPKDWNTHPLDHGGQRPRLNPPKGH